MRLEKKTKLTVSLYPSTIRKLKLYCEEHNTTVSQFLEDTVLRLKTEGDPNQESLFSNPKKK